ncbi:MAG: hypothetical protein AB7I04_19655 [Pseudomonadales bacterium]
MSAAAWILPGFAVAGATGGSAGFDIIYELLSEHCGSCHVRGQADGPWSLDTPPSADAFPECLAEPADEQLRCSTYHQLVDAPGPGIPAWIRPADGAASEPYAQACDPEASFHIGHSLPAALEDDECAAFLGWIEAGAPRGH